MVDQNLTNEGFGTFYWLGQRDEGLTVRLPELVYDIGRDLVVVHHVAHHLL
jgi:hypothetical protein